MAVSSFPKTANAIGNALRPFVQTIGQAAINDITFQISAALSADLTALGSAAVNTVTPSIADFASDIKVAHKGTGK